MKRRKKKKIVYYIKAKRGGFRCLYFIYVGVIFEPILREKAITFFRGSRGAPLIWVALPLRRKQVRLKGMGGKAIIPT